MLNGKWLFGLLFTTIPLFSQTETNPTHIACGKLYGFLIQKSKALHNSFVEVLPTDTFTVFSEQICFNQHLDSLANEDRMDEFTLIDRHNNSVILKWHPFLGIMKITYSQLLKTIKWN